MVAIRGRIDGLQVLKGGQGKATVYFDKDAMHGALDLNEREVTIESDSGDRAADEWKQRAMSMFDSLVEQLREECKPKLFEERKEENGDVKES